MIELGYLVEIVEDKENVLLSLMDFSQCKAIFDEKIDWFIAGKSIEFLNRHLLCAENALKWRFLEK